MALLSSHEAQIVGSGNLLRCLQSAPPFIASLWHLHNRQPPPSPSTLFAQNLTTMEMNAMRIGTIQRDDSKDGRNDICTCGVKDTPVSFLHHFPHSTFCNVKPL